MFKQMGTDEKLLVLFNKLSIVECKQNSFNAVMSPVHDKVEIVENCVNIHVRKIQMLAYRSLDLEARSRRNNLVFRGLTDCQSENCKELVIGFIKDELGLDMSVEQIARARLRSLGRAKAKCQVTS